MIRKQIPLIREATREDVPHILLLIRELAAFEKAPGEVTVTEEELLSDGFGNRPLFKAIIAEYDGELAGMALYFYSYSTWKGKCVYLEDIIVKKEKRGLGIGSALFEEVIAAADRYGARRLQWQVLEWNDTAIRFYKKYNASLDPEWVNGKITGEMLAGLSRKQPLK